MTLDGVDLFGEIVRPKADSVLREKFIMPPFSVLSARDGEWQERKRKWLALGIRGELGRGAGGGDMSGVTMSATIQRLKPSADQALKNARRDLE